MGDRGSNSISDSLTAITLILHTTISTMTPFLLILFALTGLSCGQLKANPRQFPADCEVLPDGLEPGLRLLPPPLPGVKGIRTCHLLGGPCTTDNDCVKPNEDSCRAEDPSFTGRIVLLNSRCVQGTCRVASRAQDEACDCLVGCIPDNSLSFPLSCTGGKCTPPSCAECGEKPNGRSCCIGATLGFNGVCECGGGGCLINSDCKGNGKCCNGGPFDGKCCSQCSDSSSPC